MGSAAPAPSPWPMPKKFLKGSLRLPPEILPVGVGAVIIAEASMVANAAASDENESLFV